MCHHAYISRCLVAVVAGSAGLALHVSCDGTPKSYELEYELRAPREITFDPMTRIDVVTTDGAHGTRLRATNQREEGAFRVYARTAPIRDGERDRGVIVTVDGRPAQVFRLPIPREPSEAGWTEWRKPDYIEDGDAAWTFMNGRQNVAGRSVAIPAEAFELRYQITPSKIQ